MGTRKRPAPPPPPPPIRAVVVDGSNVIASSTAGAAERLQLAVDWSLQWSRGLDVVVFVDHATIGRCPPAVQQELNRRFEGGDSRVRYEVAPRGAPADPMLLQQAARRSALIVTNDRYWEHEALRRDVALVQFELARGTFRPGDEATWFRGDGSAQRVALADLRPAPSP